MNRRSTAEVQQTILKSLAIRFLLAANAEPLLGMRDYYRFPERAAAWGGPFNGQAARSALFESIVAATRPRAIVETGTYLGTTTELLANAGVPVCTIEGHVRKFGYARARLLRRRNVRTFLGDSRSVLKDLLDGRLKALQKESLFFYLDAHWNADLPLAEELDIVFSRCPEAIVMIDDFQVPGDAGYVFDDYGPGIALNATYIAPAVAAHGLAVFYPSTPSEKETGERSGCVVLCQAPAQCSTLASDTLLSPA